MKRIFLLLPLITACGFEVVDTGSRGVKTTFGKVEGEPLPEGLHFYNPFTSDIVEMDVREQKLEEQTTAFTRDTQNVTITYAITYYPEKGSVGLIYQEYGKNYAEKIIHQIVLGSVKDVIGQYIADDLVSKREVAVAACEKELKDNLEKRHIVVTRLDFVNLDFDDAYEHAVEAKVVAIQNAAKARNKTVEIEEEAKQKILTAKADAEAMRIKSEALSKNKGLIQFEAIQRWDGALPKNIYGSAPIPFLNIKDGGEK